MHEYPLWRIRHRRYRTVFASFCLIAFAADAAPARDYFVNPSGVDGAFRTVQSAVDAVTGQSETDRANIYIAPGRYVERVRVEKPFISFIGQGRTAAAVAISFNSTPSKTPVDTFGESVSIQPGATAFMARNVTFENTTPDNHAGQGLALRCDADRAIFDNVRFLGYQDTLFVSSMTRVYVRHSFITGDVDFIFGNATAVFDGCTIESTDQGNITATDTRRTTANGLIFLDCKLVKGASRHDGTTARDNSVVLGRPWLHTPSQQMSSVIYIRTRMGAHIKAVGWDPWDSIFNASVDRDPYTRVSEWGSMNLAGQLLPDANQDGTPDGRVPWADPMTAGQAANYTLQNIFGPVEFWNAATQPDTPGVPYVSQGAPWNPERQLLALPSKPGEQPKLPNISAR